MLVWIIPVKASRSCGHLWSLDQKPIVWRTWGTPSRQEVFLQGSHLIHKDYQQREGENDWATGWNGGKFWVEISRPTQMSCAKWPQRVLVQDGNYSNGAVVGRGTSSWFLISWEWVDSVLLFFLKLSLTEVEPGFSSERQKTETQDTASIMSMSFPFLPKDFVFFPQ